MRNSGTHDDCGYVDRRLHCGHLISSLRAHQVTTTQHILVVDDDIYLAQALAISLRAFGYEIDVAGSGAEALASVAANRPHLVLVDLGLPDMDGVDLIVALRARSAVPIVVLSARNEDSTKVKALAAGAQHYLTKPIGLPELLGRIGTALH